MRYTFLYHTVTLACIMLLVSVGIYAQDERIEAQFHVKARQGKNSAPEAYPMEYATFKTGKKAREVMQALIAAVEKDGYPDGDAYNAALTKNRVRFKTARANGTFITRAFAGQAVLVYIDERLFHVFDIKEGKSEYAEVLDFAFGEGRIDNVDVSGHRVRKKMEVEPDDGWEDGEYMYPKLKLDISAEDVGNKVRVMVQPVAVDCQTEDTVDYLMPLVFEGKDYNDLQERRMDFDYAANERGNIAEGYQKDCPLVDGCPLSVEKTFEWKKKDIKRDYRFIYEIAAEDYTHQHKYMQASTGSCSKKKYFKFLDLAAVTADLPLDEYSIDAEETMKSVPRDLKLNFIVGKSELTNDSINDVRLGMLVKEMKEYGDQLMRIEIEAHASPDGDQRKNLLLAEKRGREAMNMVMRGLGKADVTKGLSTTVYTWNDVADRLEQRGQKSKADPVRAIADANAKPDAALRALPFYQTHIDTILQDMRSMRCVYKYEQMHIMDAEEGVEYYTENKQRLLSDDKEIKLSDGDYFNLFASVRDSAELDTITMLAYRHMTRQPEWEKLKFSQYVINRMAMLQMRSGHPDPHILDAYVDTTDNNVTERYTGPNRAARERVQKNRREILINYIMSYYQMEMSDSANMRLRYWFEDSSDPMVNTLKNYVFFKRNFAKYYQFPDRMTEQEKETFRQTEEYVLDCSPDNRAVLYTEARTLMGKSSETCHELVSRMSDGNAKKWYLLGILEADEEAKKADDRVAKSYVPLYLALFYKSFTIDPNLRTVYFNDGQVDNNLREKYKYRKRDIPVYEELLIKYMSGEDKEESDEISGDYNEDEQ